ncbi:HEAT repeat domain-containing protein [Chryseomicrobium aureum]|uniref:HEAT repeat domain-containing protein n=1 Tax=Chryseomicrobium aureum TaxID=1441723 RepID=UPI00370DC2B7
MKELLEEKRVDEALEVVENLTDSQVQGSEKELLQILTSADDASLRNSIALRMSDAKCQQVAPCIIDLLKDPKTKGNRGTLLYALHELNYSEHIEVLLPFLADPSFEVSREAYALVKPHFRNLTKKQKNETKALLEAYLEDLRDEIDFRKGVLSVLKK